jgi:hypothetical protein
MQQALKTLLNLSTKADSAAWLGAERQLLDHLSTSSPQEFSLALEHLSQNQKGSGTCWLALENYAAKNVARFNSEQFEKVYYSIGSQRKAPETSKENDSCIQEITSRIDSLMARTLENKEGGRFQGFEAANAEKRKTIGNFSSFPQMKSKMDESIRLCIVKAHEITQKKPKEIKEQNDSSPSTKADMEKNGENEGFGEKTMRQRMLRNWEEQKREQSLIRSVGFGMMPYMAMDYFRK